MDEKKERKIAIAVLTLLIDNYVDGKSIVDQEDIISHLDKNYNYRPDRNSLIEVAKRINSKFNWCDPPIIGKTIKRDDFFRYPEHLHKKLVFGTFSTKSLLKELLQEEIFELNMSLQKKTS